MLTDHFAKPLLNHPIELSWWCEEDKHARSFCNHVSPAGVPNFDNALSPAFILGAPPVDIISAGFPCQVFSTMGHNLGDRDPRGVVILGIILYMKKTLPRVAILENVPGLLANHCACFQEVLKRIRDIKEPSTGDRAYFTSFKLMDSRKHGGVPQARSRLYIVCIRRFGKQVDFKWPGQIECASLRSIFDRDAQKLESYINYPIPRIAIL